MSPPAHRNATHVLVLGNQRLYRLGLCRLIDSIPRVKVVADQPLTLPALTLALRTVPDLLIVDLGGETHGNLELITSITREVGPMPIILVTGETCAGCLAALTRLSVYAILSTWADRDELIEAIARAKRAEPYVSRDLVMPATDDTGHSAADFDRLSSRQRQILEFIAHGTGIREIAENLGISIKTVETHRARARTILGLKDTNALRVYAIKVIQARDSAALKPE